MQQTPTLIDERELYLKEVCRTVKLHKRNVEARIAKDAMTLESLVRALREPRGVARSHIDAFRDYIRSIVRVELGGVQ